MGFNGVRTVLSMYIIHMTKLNFHRFICFLDFRSRNSESELSQNGLQFVFPYLQQNFFCHYIYEDYEFWNWLLDPLSKT